jgi:hypothetical protein
MSLAHRNRWELRHIAIPYLTDRQNRSCTPQDPYFFEQFKAPVFRENDRELQSVFVQVSTLTDWLEDRSFFTLEWRIANKENGLGSINAPLDLHRRSTADEDLTKALVDSGVGWGSLPPSARAIYRSQGRHSRYFWAM